VSNVLYGEREKGVLAQIKDVENSLPFPLLGFDTDNRSELLNWHLFRDFTQRAGSSGFLNVSG